MLRRSKAAGKPFRIPGEYEPTDAREPLVSFWSQGYANFQAVVAALEAGSGPIVVCARRSGNRVRRGRAIEVDGSGIVRVEPLIENGHMHGVAFLLSMVEGVLHGEFTD